VFDKAIERYAYIKESIEELTSLLQYQLEKANVDFDDDAIFSDLIKEIKNINAIYKKEETPIEPIYNEYELYSKYDSITKFNIILLKRIKYLQEYLKFYLDNMGVDENYIQEATTLKDLILLIDKIEKVENTHIIYNVNTDSGPVESNVINLTVDINNTLDIKVITDELSEVSTGNIDVYYENILINSFNIGDEIIIKPLEVQDNIEYTFKFNDSTGRYNPSEKTFTVNILPPHLEGQIELTNTTNYSQYYESHYEGYTTDLWDIRVNIKNTSGQSANIEIPFKICLHDESHTIIEGNTNVAGEAIFHNVSIPNPSSDFISNEDTNEEGNINYNISIFLETTLLDTSQYINIKEYSTVKIYNSPVQIPNDYEYYATDPNMPTFIVLELHDEYTNELIDDSSYYVMLGDRKITNINDPVEYNFNNLHVGEETIIFDVYYNEQKITEARKNIIIKSNFDIPVQQRYYLPNTPNIYYKPYGEAKKSNDGVIVNDEEVATNEYGLITNIKNIKDAGTHELNMQANTNGLTEIVSYSYQLYEPFTINQIAYDSKKVIIYRIIINTEDGGLSNKNIEDFVTIKNHNKDIPLTDPNVFIDVELHSDYILRAIILIVTNEITHGNNTLIVNFNGYEERDDFTLSYYSDVFTLLTTEINAGYNKTIEIECVDPDIEDITIEGNGITFNNCIKNNNVFTLNCDFLVTGDININIISDEGRESDTIKVLKNDINARIDIEGTHTEDNECDISNVYNGNTNLVFESIDSIPVILNNGEASSSYENFIGITNMNMPNKPGIYTATFTFNGNDLYNSSFKTLLYKVLPNNNTSLNLTTDSYLIDDISSSATLTATYMQEDCNYPIANAQIILKKNGKFYAEGTTGTNGKVSFTVTDPNEYIAEAVSEDTTMYTSNSIQIQGIVEENEDHIISDIELSYESSELIATVYDQYRNKVKNKTVNFYKILEDTEFEITDYSQSIIYSERAYINGKLSSNGSGLANKTIKIKYNNQTDIVTTNTDGTFTYANQALPSGNITLTLVFEGDTIYDEATIQRTIAISKIPTSISFNTDGGSSYTQVTGFLKDDYNNVFLADKEVVIRVFIATNTAQSYTTTTSNSIDELGKYLFHFQQPITSVRRFIVYFASDDIYDAATYDTGYL